MARSEELRAAEADAWKKPANSTEPPNSARPSGSAREEVTQREPVDEQPQPQPDLADSGMAVSTETPDAEATWWTRILTEKSDLQCRPKVPKRMRIWSKHSRPLTPAVVSEQAGETCKDSYICFGEQRDIRNEMLESDGNLESPTG